MLISGPGKLLSEHRANEYYCTYSYTSSACSVLYLLYKFASMQKFLLGCTLLLAAWYTGFASLPLIGMRTTTPPPKAKRKKKRTPKDKSDTAKSARRAAKRSQTVRSKTPGARSRPSTGPRNAKTTAPVTSARASKAERKTAESSQASGAAAAKQPSSVRFRARPATTEDLPDERRYPPSRCTGSILERELTP